MKKLHQSEKGIASLIITLVLMIVISLIVLGFAQIARREQRNSLDRQLSTQAFYAAESGVNNAKSILSHISPANIPAKTTCQGGSPTYSPLTAESTIDAVHNVSYSCVLVTPFVSQLLKQPQSPDTDWIVPIVPVTSSGAPTGITTLTVQWTAQDSGNAHPTNGCSMTNPVATGWSPCDFSLLRFEMVPTDSLDRASLQANDMVNFFYPTSSSSGGTTAYSPGAQQSPASCDDTGLCTMTIGLPLDASNNPKYHSYYVRIHTLYASTNLTITGANNATPVDFSGAQVQIDSTGKAQDVLRRIRVSYALTAGANYPQEAIESRDSICKRFAVYPLMAGLPTSALDSSNPYCGAAPVAMPAPAPDPTANNSAQITGLTPCSPTGTPTCPARAPKTEWHFAVTLINNSSSATPGNVRGCVWHWDDGSPDTGSPTDPSHACLITQAIYHVIGGQAVYTSPPPPSKCRVYNITLTEYFTSGAPATATYPARLPYGPATPPC